MDLPDSLRLALSHELANVSQKQVAEAASNLSLRYRSRQPTANGSFLHSYADVQAYAAVRLPATFAALYSVLSAVRIRKPTWQPRTMLDAGAGPGTAMWAASELWTKLELVKLLEREEAMIAFGKQLSTYARSSTLQQDHWQKVDLLSQWSNAPCDLVITSYVLGELDTTKCAAYIAKLWSITADTLVIIEPGTPVGFSHIRIARQQLIAAGAHILAPCPHTLTCPMTGGEWCHFAQRITRTQLHRSAKQADLSYEDEKFSYIAASRTPGTAIESRVIRHPQIRPGHIHLELCSLTGLKNTVVTRKDKGAFRQARALHWGDALSVDTEE